MSDRPRTDALFDRCKNKSNIECMAELEELCRTIEGELSDVTKQRDALADALKRWSIIREWLEMDFYIKGYMSNEKDFFDGLDKTLAATKGGSHE